MSVAIDINPEFNVSTEAGSLKNLYNLDTGSEDLNRTICVRELSTRGFKGVNVKGFNEYIRFSSLIDLDSFVDDVKDKGFGFDIKEYRNKSKSNGGSIDATHVKASDSSKESNIKHDDYTVVMGNVSINLDNGEVLQLCSPIYRVYPNKKGEYLDIDVVKDYITEEWTEVSKQAFFSKPEAGVVATKKRHDDFNLSTTTKILVMALLLGVLTLGFAMLNKNSTGESVSYNATSSIPSQHKTVAPTGGDNQTVEDYAKLQVKQTENMLKELGVDVSTQNNNLGCFTSGG